MSLKHRPISFLLTVLTATISLNVLGTPSCLHAIYKQALAMASFALPFRFRPSCTILNKDRSELLTVRWLVYDVAPSMPPIPIPPPPKPPAPLLGPIMVDKSLEPSRVFS